MPIWPAYHVLPAGLSGGGLHAEDDRLASDHHRRRPLPDDLRDAPTASPALQMCTNFGRVGQFSSLALYRL
jgi:hypothetical protein